MTPRTERIDVIDVLRGIALLGIVLLNIIMFGQPYAAYFNPVVDAATEGINLLSYELNWVFVEGAMRAIFSMLFGAGILLFTGKSTAPDEDEIVRRLYFRRTFVLIAFGLVDMFALLWLGDVLYVYGLAGLVLYFFRNQSARALAIIGMTLIVVMVLEQTANTFALSEQRAAAARVELVEAGDTEPSPRDRQAAARYLVMQAAHLPTEADIAQEIEARQGDYLGNVVTFAPAAWQLATADVFTGALWDVLAMMFLGMAFFKWHILTGRRSVLFYGWFAALGFSIGLPINVMEVYFAMIGNFTLDWTSPYFTPTYQLGRGGTACGYIGLVMLWCRSDRFRRLQNALAAVGKMALTNYLSHSLICLFIFTGAGLALFGQIERAQLYLIVLAIWAFQLVTSPLWLNRYRFGPLEFIWRWMTYGSRPPQRLSDSYPKPEPS